MHGLADEMARRGIPCVGPRLALARMEGDKTFLRDLASRHAPEANPRHRVCASRAEARLAIAEMGNVVVKPLGLTSGKGVRVMGTQLASTDEAETYAAEVIAKDARVLLEERLEGEEYSQMVFTDGVHVVPMPLVQDAKYAFEGDTGPMTGGMGAYSESDHRLPFVTQTASEQAVRITEKLLIGAQDELGVRYHGIVYGQFMLTHSGPVLVEVNVRLGDPEAINVMSTLQSDPAEVFAGMVCGLQQEVHFAQKATVCKYLVPQAYPEPSQGDAWAHFDADILAQEGVEVIYAGARQDGAITRPTGSRFAAILAVRDDRMEAEAAVERAIARLESAGLRHRQDIATPELVDRRVQHMQSVLKQ
jgi:phosphoribosylamine--glycine ligase